MTDRNHSVARQFRLRRGLDLVLAGAPASTLGLAPATGSVALLGADFPLHQADARVAVGDRVTLGQPLLHDRHDPALLFTSPGTGTVSDIAFGDRRTLRSVVITARGRGPRRRHSPSRWIPPRRPAR